MLSFLHPSLPRSRVSNGSLMGDYVWDPFTRQYNSSVAFLLLFLICLRSILHTAALSNTVMIISSSLPHPDFSVAPFLPLRLLFNCWVVSDSLQPHELQHTRLPCPSLSSRVCSNSCPLSQWYLLTISSSVTCFSPYLQSFPGSFPMSQFFTSGGLSIGASASTSVLLMNIQDWFPLDNKILPSSNVIFPMKSFIYSFNKYLMLSTRWIEVLDLVNHIWVYM